MINPLSKLLPLRFWLFVKQNKWSEDFTLGSENLWWAFSTFKSIMNKNRCGLKSKTHWRHNNCCFFFSQFTLLIIIRITRKQHFIRYFGSLVQQSSQVSSTNRCCKGEVDGRRKQSTDKASSFMNRKPKRNDTTVMQCPSTIVYVTAKTISLSSYNPCGTTIKASLSAFTWSSNKVIMGQIVSHFVKFQGLYYFNSVWTKTSFIWRNPFKRTVLFWFMSRYFKIM